MATIEENKIIKGIPAIVCKRGDSLKKPLVIMSHGFTNSKESYKSNGCLKCLAEAGYYAVAIDNRLHGDRPGPHFSTTIIESSGKVNLFLLRKAIKETADDVRLLIDELSLLEEIDKNNIAMIGISMGGFITYRSIVTDDRIKVGIPIISSPFWDDIPGDVPVNTDEKAETDWKILSETLQPSNYPDKFYPTSLLIQVGDIDKHYDITKVKEFYNKLTGYYHDSSEKLKLIVYPNTGHEFTQEMWAQALQWLKENFLL